MPSRRSSWSKATPSLPPLPALLPTTSRLRAVSILQMETLQPKRAENCLRSQGRVVAEPLPVAPFYSALSAGSSPYPGSPRQLAPMLGACPPSSRNPYSKPCFRSPGLGIKQHLLWVPNSSAPAPFQVLHKLSATPSSTLLTPTHPQAQDGPGTSSSVTSPAG